MVKKVLTRMTFWKCEKCGRDFPSRLDAVACEKQKPKKIPLMKGNTKTEYWDKGDIIMSYGRSDEIEWMLGVIKDTIIQGHYIVPVIEPLDSIAREWSNYSFRNLVILSEDMKLKIKAWADIISYNPDKVV